MFNLNTFIMRTLRKMVAYELEYKVRKIALNWYEKGELTDENMSEIDSYYPEIIENQYEEEVE